MSDTPKSVRLQPAQYVSRPMVEVDCSDWESDIPAEAWSHGPLINLVENLPVVDVDGSSWVEFPDEKSWVELTLRYPEPADQADRQVIQSLATRMIEAIAAAAPELRLVYDMERSRRDGDRLVIALATTASDAESRLVEIATRVRQVAASNSEFEIFDIRVYREAA